MKRYCLLLVLAMAFMLPAWSTVKGDVTGDNKVDVEDVNAVINIILELKTASYYPGVSDLTGDGKIDVEDVNLIINYILNPDTGPVGPEDATVIEVNGVKFKMVNVDGGTFTMGATSEQGGDASDSEKPAHQVTLSSYSIGATEVTQELWQAVMGSNPSRFSPANGYTENLQRPVEMVSFEDCSYRFITKLNQLTGRTFRLPTEAEWEYAARGGNKSKGYKYAGSNTVNDVCWYWDDLPSQTSLTAGYGTQPVGRKAPNELGLYDMSGNVWEWTLDNNVDYPSVPETDPNHQAGGMPWVYRGGGWASYASSCRVSKRDWANATKAFNFVGMRLVSIPTPVISVTSNSLEFEGVRSQTYTKEITVSGEYLRGPIKVNLNTGSSTVFFVSTTSISESAAQTGAKLTVTFRSSFAGDYRGTITLSSPNAADVVIPLHGYITTPAITVTGNSLEFESFVNQSETKTITVTGTHLEGAVNAFVSSGGGVFSVSPSSISQSDATGGATLRVTYRPTAVGTSSGKLTLTSEGANEVSVTLTGVGKLPPPGPDNAEICTVNGVSFKMVPVEGGTFTMGATEEQGDDSLDDEKPAHQVTLSSYSIGATEVTQELWLAVMGTNPSHFTSNNNGDLQRPVEWVSWDDCQKFITRLRVLTGKNFRLPTEAEWEYAARGGNKSKGYKYAGSNTLGDVAWYWDNIPSQDFKTDGYGTQPVGTKAPNELGLYDMSGNVYEWCQDWYGEYGSGEQTNPIGFLLGSSRVCRGGCWGGPAGYCRVSRRFSGSAETLNYNLGLRLAL